MIAPNTVKTYVLPPPDAAWVMRTWVRTSERSINRAHLLLKPAAGGKRPSKATLYRNRKKGEGTNSFIIQGDFADALFEALGRHPGMTETVRYRVLGLLCQHALVYRNDGVEYEKCHPVLTKDGIHPNPYWEVMKWIFGEDALFQGITCIAGPLAMAFLAHSITLYPQPSGAKYAQILHYGPYPRPEYCRACKKKISAVSPRNYENWLQNKVLPRPGWFLKKGTSPRAPGASSVSTDASETYYWADQVTPRDYLIYQYARTMVVVIQLLRSLPGDDEQKKHERAITLLKELLLIPPIKLQNWSGQPV